MTPLPANIALDAYFLDARARLLDIAAMLDRVQRGEGTAGIASDPRMLRIEKSLEALMQKTGIDRAAQIQQIFSLDYDPAWKVPPPRY